MTISEAFDYTIRQKRRAGAEIKTIRNYVTAKNSIAKVVPDIPIQLFTQEHAAQWTDYMLGRAMQPSSISRYISCLRAVLDEMDNMGLTVLESTKIKRVKVRRSNRQVWLLPSEVQSMLDAAENPRDKAMVALLFSLGCRPGEMLNLNRSDVLKDELTITNDKTGQDYPVFIAPYARRALDEYLETRRDTLIPLFVSGQRRRITVSRVEQIFHEIADKAKQEFPEAWEKDKNVTPYVMRHSHATDLLLNGANLVEVKDALGHASIATTQIYTHIPDVRRKMVRDNFHTKLK